MSTILFWVAAGAAALTFCVHVFAGGVKVMRPLLASDLPEQLKGFLYLGWHSATVAIGAIALGFAAAAYDPAQADYAVIAAALAASLVVAALITAIKLKLPPARFPVVPLFGLVTALGVAGLLT